jgi:hypothetical protein
MNQITLERFLTLLYNGEYSLTISLLEHQEDHRNNVMYKPNNKRPTVKMDYPTGKMGHSDYYNLLHSVPPRMSAAANKYIKAGWENVTPPSIGVSTRAARGLHKA